jgi:hypothetical protein
MRTIRRWARVRTPVEIVVVTALLAMVGRPGAAQQPANAAVQDSTPLTLLLVVFPDTTTAQNAMTNLSAGPTAADTAQPDKNAAPPNTVGNPAPTQWVEPYYAMVSKDKKGKVSVQHHGTKGTTVRDTRAANSIDGVAALLGKRPSKNDKSVSGAGATRAGISSANMSEMQNMLTPGNTALIIVVPQTDAADVSSQMKQADATQVYDAPLVVVPVQ